MGEPPPDAEAEGVVDGLLKVCSFFCSPSVGVALEPKDEVPEELLLDDEGMNWRTRAISSEEACSR